MSRKLGKVIAGGEKRIFFHRPKCMKSIPGFSQNGFMELEFKTHLWSVGTN